MAEPNSAPDPEDSAPQVKTGFCSDSVFRTRLKVERPNLLNHSAVFVIDFDLVLFAINVVVTNVPSPKMFWSVDDRAASTLISALVGLDPKTETLDLRLFRVATWPITFSYRLSSEPFLSVTKDQFTCSDKKNRRKNDKDSA